MSSRADTLPYPITSFNFYVDFMGGEKTISECSFQEVSGLSAEMQTEEVNEGGENRFSYKLPKGMKYPNLILKRGMIDESSVLRDWLNDSFIGGLAKEVNPRDIFIDLMDADGNLCMGWTVYGAYPVKWELSTLSAENNQLAIETLEMAYTFFEKIY